jgi:predicted regulator of Ras-like GTPase activity (Roadblock/LC7/MglB family)
MSELDLDTLQRWTATAPDSSVLLHVSDALALIALAREAVALRERMDAAREMVEKAGIALPVRRNGDADFRIVDGDGLVIAGGVHDEDSETAAAIVARERNPWRPIEGAPKKEILDVWVPASERSEYGYRVRDAFWWPDTGLWHDEDDDALDPQPTHFMLLPEVPDAPV